MREAIKPDLAGERKAKLRKSIENELNVTIIGFASIEQVIHSSLQL